MEDCQLLFEPICDLLPVKVEVFEVFKLGVGFCQPLLKVFYGLFQRTIPGLTFLHLLPKHFIRMRVPRNLPLAIPKLTLEPIPLHSNFRNLPSHGLLLSLDGKQHLPEPVVLLLEITDIDLPLGPLHVHPGDQFVLAGGAAGTGVDVVAGGRHLP
jgi:hypothetical protein